MTTVAKKKTKKEHKCPRCDKKFINITDLKRHLGLVPYSNTGLVRQKNCEDNNGVSMNKAQSIVSGEEVSQDVSLPKANINTLTPEELLHWQNYLKEQYYKFVEVYNDKVFGKTDNLIPFGKEEYDEDEVKELIDESDSLMTLVNIIRHIYDNDDKPSYKSLRYDKYSHCFMTFNGTKFISKTSTKIIQHVLNIIKNCAELDKFHENNMNNPIDKIHDFLGLPPFRYNFYKNWYLININVNTEENRCFSLYSNILKVSLDPSYDLYYNKNQFDIKECEMTSYQDF